MRTPIKQPKIEYKRGSMSPLSNYKEVGYGIIALCCEKTEPCPEHDIKSPKDA